MFESRKDFIAKAQAYARTHGISDDRALHTLARNAGYRNWFAASKVMSDRDTGRRYHLDSVRAYWPRGMGTTTVCCARHDPRPDARRIYIESGPMPGEKGILIHHSVLVVEGFNTPRDRRVVFDCQPEFPTDKTLPAWVLNALFDRFLRDHRPRLPPEADRRRRVAQKLRALGFGMTNDCEDVEDVWYLSGADYVITLAAVDGHPLCVTESSLVKIVIQSNDPDDNSKVQDVFERTVPLTQALLVVRSLLMADSGRVGKGAGRVGAEF